MKNLLIAALVALVALSAGCSPSREEIAQRTLDDAVDAYINRKYTHAKILLDSVIYAFPENRKAVREARDLKRVVFRTEQERNLAFLDSLLQIREAEIAPYMSQFYIEDSKADMPIFVHKRQSAQSASERCYVRGYTDKNGTFYISSHYTGEGHIHHNRIRVSVGNDYVETDSVCNEALNHAFRSGEQVWEVVKYKGGDDNGAGEFIARHFEQRIGVVFVGEKVNYKIFLSDTDKRAIRETYYLSLLLRETIQIKSQIRNVKTALKDVRVD